MLTRLCLVALLAVGLVALAAPGPASAAPVKRKCGNTNHGAGRVHTKNLRCKKGRRIANFYESHGRCPSGWKLRKFGHVDSPGGTWDECKKGIRWVRWTEFGE